MLKDIDADIFIASPSKEISGLMDMNMFDEKMVEITGKLMPLLVVGPRSG